MNEKEKFEEKKEKNNYEKIGPTAWGVAWHRSLSDIKYAKEIFDELDEVVKPTEQTEIEYMESARESKIAPQIEARYKLIDKLMMENKTDQVLELAAGLVGRGLAMTEEDSSLQYVEVDLPEMAKNKRALLRNFFSKGKAEPQEGLHIEDGNALDRDSLFAATKYFKDKPITVIHEGLLRYLNFEEKKTVANNVHALLEKFGGTWITSDITLKRVLSGERQEERDDNRKRVFALSGIDIGANTFESEDDAKRFFEELGFSVARHGFMEVVDELVSPARIGLPRDAVENLLKDPVVFVMRLQK